MGRHALKPASNTGSATMASELRLDPPQKVTIVESIIEQLVTQIRDGSLRPNDRLPSERQLIDMLGVGRSSVREALKGLSAMGLVEIRPGEGTFVRELRPGEDLFNTDIQTLSRGLQKEMRKHLNQARLALETGILTVAAEVKTKEGDARIRQALAAYEQDLSQDPADVDWTVHDQLHLALAEATGNDILVDMLHRLIELVPYSLRDLQATNVGREEMSQFYSTWGTIHRQLCDAVLSGDARSARAWMRRHSEYEDINIERDYGGLPTSVQKEYQEAIRRMA
jgi:GntR family transcriptional repressor for pyruvate dehydrogenase complex